MKTIKELILSLLFGRKCPDCNKGRLKLHMLDMEYDKPVFKCNKCDKEYI